MLSSAHATDPIADPADVCLIVEGCYPYVPGGVSAWIDWLMRSLPETRFKLVALWPRPMAMKSRYSPPPNLIGIDHLYLQQFGAKPVTRGAVPLGIEHLGESLTRLTTQGGAAALSEVMQELALMRRHTSLDQLFNSPASWRLDAGLPPTRSRRANGTSWPGHKASPTPTSTACSTPCRWKTRRRWRRR